MTEAIDWENLIGEPHIPRRSIVGFFRDAPVWLINLVTRMGRWSDLNWSRGSDDDREWDELEIQEVVPWAPPSLEHDDGRKEVKRLWEVEALSSDMKYVAWPGVKPQHVLALDIDHLAVLLPSSTGGHSHLIINHLLDEDAWREIVFVLGKHGVIEDGYAQASLRRGATFLRAPWISKGTEEADRIAAFGEWLDHDVDFTDTSKLHDWRKTLSRVETLVGDLHDEADPF